ncbi:MAG TPA: type II secretion system minor pseudopilin GspI [Usitatibacteraceae bacterium]|nr:type II secretion system minor pseudopilin GspI [Usitatibacteraceae bacterium]
MSRERAFTLVEILVAMAILAIALAATTRAASLATDGARDTRARLLATWSAGNRMAEMRARGLFPAPAVTTATVEQGGLSLVVEETVTDTPNPTIRRVDFSISDARVPGRVLATHTAFLVRP